MRIKDILYWRVYYKILQLCVRLFYYLPVNKRKIVLMHDFGNAYGDSPKFTPAALIRRSFPSHLVCLLNNMSYSFPKPIRKVKLSHIKSVYELATAKVIITTMKGRCNLKKKKNQFFM